MLQIKSRFVLAKKIFGVRCTLMFKRNEKTNKYELETFHHNLPVRESTSALNDDCVNRTLVVRKCSVFGLRNISS